MWSLIVSIGSVFSACAEVVPLAARMDPYKSGILRVRGGSSSSEACHGGVAMYSPRARR